MKKPAKLKSLRWLLGHVEPIAPLVPSHRGESIDPLLELSNAEPQAGPNALVGANAPIDSNSISKLIEEKFYAPDEQPVQTVKQQQQTLRPIVCLAFVMPLVLLYEIGMIVFQSESHRSGVDYGLQQIFETFGAGQLVILPLVTSAILLVWHHRLHDQWQFKPMTLLWMAVEVIGLGVILFLAADATSLIMLGKHPPPLVGLLDLICDPAWCSNAIRCFGAGIYEELLFRLAIFLPLFTWLARKLNDDTVALVASMLIVSLLFALVHYDVINPAGEPWKATTFMFRFAASMVLCALFKFRGFGVAVGVHVVFDVLMLT